MQRLPLDADALPPGLLEHLQTAGREDARRALRLVVRRPGADPAALARALLLQPQAQLRAHGLLAARLAGRADLILPALTTEGSGDGGTWKAAAALLSQMDVGQEAAAALLQWLLSGAPPVQRLYFLTVLGRLGQRPLGAALFDGLLAAGRHEWALRLVRHAGALRDERLAALVRRHMVEAQDPREAAPTWMRQAWKRLAVARPALALQLLGELWGKVQAACERRSSRAVATTTLRRAVLALLHGVAGRQAADALLFSADSFIQCLPDIDYEIKYGGCSPLDQRLLQSGDAKGTARPPFVWFHARRQLELLEVAAGSGGAGAGADPAATQVAAQALFTMALGRRACTGKQAPRRWLLRLHRRGLLGQVLRQATLQGRRVSMGKPLDITVTALEQATLEQAARMAAGGDSTAAEALMVDLAAGDAERSLQNLLRDFWPRARSAEGGHSERASSCSKGGYEEEEEQQLLLLKKAEDTQPWRRWPAGSPLQHWPVRVLVRGLDLLARDRDRVPWRPPADAVTLEQLATGRGAEDRVFERVRGYIQWAPAHRDEVLASSFHQPFASERAAAYSELLRGCVPHASAAAANDVVPWVLRHTRNEREQVREKVLGWMSDAGVLRLLDERHVGLVEAALESALAAPDCSRALKRHVLRLAGEALRLGVQQPTTSWLPTGLRLHASLLQRCRHRQEGGGEDSRRMLESALAPDKQAGGDVLEGSSDVLLVASILLAQLLPLYRQGGQQDVEGSLLRCLTRCHTALAPLRQLPELKAAVEQWLADRYAGRGTGEAAGEEAGMEADAASESEEESEDKYSCSSLNGDILSWWLSDSEEFAVLQRAQASRTACELGPDRAAAASHTFAPALQSLLAGGSATAAASHTSAPALQCLLAGGPAAPAVIDFIPTKLCGEWLLMPPADAPPAALWWQQQVLADGKLLGAVVWRHEKACWRLIETGAPIGDALLSSTRPLRTLMRLQGAGKHCLRVLCAGGPASQRLCAQRWLLEHLSASFPAACRTALGKPAGAALLQALLQQQVWAPSLFGACPAFDSAALEAALSEGEGPPRLEHLEALMEGYSRRAAQPRLRPDGRGGSRLAYADPGDDGFWAVRRHLESTDFRRWPPAVQALLRRLFSEVAAAPGAQPRTRNAAVVRLARLQDACPADLEPLLGDKRMWACLLCASDLPDKRATARFLASLATQNGLAGLAGSAFSRLAVFLPAADLAELCGDLLSTAGLQASAWEHVVTALLQRGTPEALELALAEMERPGLTDTMRCTLLGASCHLAAHPRVRAFWERCAAAPFGPPAVAVLQLADASMLCGDIGAWWAGLVLHILRSAETKQQGDACAQHLSASGAWCALKGSQPAAVALLDGLFSLAQDTDAPSWSAAVALLQHRRGRQWEEAALRGHLQRLLDASAAELQAISSPPITPATSLVDLLVPDMLDPWRLGCRMPRQVLQLLWSPYCEHLVAAALKIRKGEASFEHLAADGGAEHLAGLLGEALEAAPSAAHLVPLAIELTKQAGLAFWDELPHSRAAAEAALAAAHALDAAAGQAGQAAADRAGHDLLVTALAAWPVLYAGTQAATLAEAEALVRRCLQRPGSMVGLLLSDGLVCGDKLFWSAGLRAAVLGTQQASDVPFLQTHVKGRPSASLRGGRPIKRVAVDPMHLH